MSPLNWYSPGDRTSPSTKTCWLRNASMATVTWGVLRKPSASLVFRSCSNSRWVIPRALTRPTRGNVKVPSGSTANFPERSGSPKTVMVNTSCGPMR